MTLNPADRIGMNAGAAATNAARLRAAAAAAAGRVGGISAASSTDRNESRSVQAPAHPRKTPGAVVPGTVDENRVRTVTAFARTGPSRLFLVQRIAQETVPAEAPDFASATDYPSLAPELDVFLPGEQIPFVTDSPRIDRLV